MEWDGNVENKYRNCGEKKGKRKTKRRKVVIDCGEFEFACPL